MKQHSAGNSLALTLELTLEQALYAGLFMLALTLRLWSLGSIPLDATEGATALQSWWMYKGLPTTAQGSPLLVNLNSFVFLLFGASDASARALPALAGSAVVVLPYFGRLYIGRTAAFVVAVLLAVSPTSIYFSRYVGDATLVAVLSLGLVMCFAKYARAYGAGKEHGGVASDRFLYLSAALLGLLLSAGVAGFLNAFVFVAFLVIVALQRFSQASQHSRSGAMNRGAMNRAPTRRRAVSTLVKTAVVRMLALGKGWGFDEGLGVLPAPADLWPGSQKAQRWAIVFVATFVIAVTGGLTNLHGLQEGTVDTLAPYLGARGRLDISPYYVQILLVYETLTVVLAAVNVLYSRERKELFSWFMIWWAGASLLVLTLMPQKTAALVVQPLLPISYLAAELIGSLLEWFAEKKPVVGLGLLALVSLPAIFLLGFLLSRFSLQQGESMPWPFAVGLLFVLVLAFVGALYWKGGTYATNLWGLLWITILFGLALHTTANLSFQQEPNPAEWLRGKATTADVRTLVSDVDLVRSGAVGLGLSGDVVVEHPQTDILGWYLRKHNPKLSLLSLADSKPLMVVGRPDMEMAPGDWAMQRYAISASSSPWPRAANMDQLWRQLWRWLIYREAPAPTQYDNVVLYVAL